MLRDEAFFLIYGSKGGFTHHDVMSLDRVEVVAYIQRLNKQLKSELDAVKGKKK